MLEKESKTRELLAEYLKLGGKIDQLPSMKSSAERTLRVYTFADDSSGIDKRMTNNELSSSQRYTESDNTSEFTDFESEKVLEQLRATNQFFNGGTDVSGDLANYGELAELANFEDLEKAGLKVSKKVKQEAEDLRTAEPKFDDDEADAGVSSLKSVSSSHKARSKLRRSVHSMMNKSIIDSDTTGSEASDSSATSPRKLPTSQSTFELRSKAKTSPRKSLQGPTKDLSPRKADRSSTKEISPRKSESSSKGVSEEIKRRVPAKILASVGPPPNEPPPGNTRRSVFVKTRVTVPKAYSPRFGGIRTYGTAKELMNLADEAAGVLRTGDAHEKCAKTSRIIAKLRESNQEFELDNTAIQIPDHPVRSDKPILVSPKDMPNAKKAGVPTAPWLLHSLAHIEITAVEMAWDTVLRFSNAKLPHQFFFDFVKIASDEARHFVFLCERLKFYGFSYGLGDIPAHNNLWTIADKTKNDLIARIATIQMVQEPRALDSGDRLVSKFISVDDKESSKLMKLICEEEIEHVRIGVKWYEMLCAENGLNPVEHYHKIVREHVGLIPPPFNATARGEAGMIPDYYEPVALRPKKTSDQQKPTKHRN